MLGRYNAYEEDVTIIKQLGDYRLKVINIPYCRISGLELDERTFSKKNSVHTEKLANNIVRAKTSVFELAACNDWSYFVTFTIDPNKYDRYNLDSFRHDLCEFLHNFNRRRSVKDKIVYLLIPEMHKDGAWHMHGLIFGLSEDELYINQNGYRGWSKYEQRFGYLSLAPVRDKDRICSYITKYLTKELDKNVTELGGHLYYASKGLKRSEQIFRGKASLLCDWDYEHPDGYCRVKTFDIRKDDYTDYLKLE